MSLAPATTSCWSAMVAITGSAAFGVELGRVGAAEAGQVAGRLDDDALQAKAQAEGRDPVDPGVGDRADLALDAAHAEPAGDQHALHVGQCRGGAGHGLMQSSEATQTISTLALLPKPPARSASVTDR